jgi:hypothetical protein
LGEGDDIEYADWDLNRRGAGGIAGVVKRERGDFGIT